jgi:hypothetical protein
VQRYYFILIWQIFGKSFCSFAVSGDSLLCRCLFFDVSTVISSVSMIPVFFIRYKDSIKSTITHKRIKMSYKIYRGKLQKYFIYLEKDVSLLHSNKN